MSDQGTFENLDSYLKSIEEEKILTEPKSSDPPPFDESKVLVVLGRTADHVVVSQPDTFLYKPGDKPGVLKQLFNKITSDSETGYAIKSYTKEEFDSMLKDKKWDLNSDTASLENYIAAVGKGEKPETVSEKLDVIDIKHYKACHDLIDDNVRNTTSSAPIVGIELGMEHRIKAIQQDMEEIPGQWKTLEAQNSLLKVLPHSMGEALPYDYDREGAEGEKIPYKFLSAPVLIAENENGGLIHQPVMKDRGTGDVKLDAVVYCTREELDTLKSTGRVVDYDKFKNDINYAASNPDKAQSSSDIGCGFSRLNEMVCDVEAFEQDVKTQREEIYPAAVLLGVISPEQAEPDVKTAPGMIN